MMSLFIASSSRQMQGLCASYICKLRISRGLHSYAIGLGHLPAHLCHTQIIPYTKEGILDHFP